MGMSSNNNNDNNNKGNSTKSAEMVRATSVRTDTIDLVPSTTVQERGGQVQNHLMGAETYNDNNSNNNNNTVLEPSVQDFMKRIGEKDGSFRIWSGIEDAGKTVAYSHLLSAGKLSAAAGEIGKEHCNGLTALGKEHANGMEKSSKWIGGGLALISGATALSSAAAFASAAIKEPKFHPRVVVGVLGVSGFMYAGAFAIYTNAYVHALTKDISDNKNR